MIPDSKIIVNVCINRAKKGHKINSMWPKLIKENKMTLSYDKATFGQLVFRDN